jgi:cysteine desulfurase
VQAANFCDCNTKYLHVDMMSVSSHKIYGPKGIGCLFVKKGTPLSAIQLGGHHENNLRSGTLNAPSIVGMGEALYLADKNREKNNANIAKLRDVLVKEIKKKIKNVIINTDVKYSSPSHANIIFAGAEGESILIALDLQGIAVSTGSACASGDLKASPVLLAMGIKEELSHGAIRFTLGKSTTETEIKMVVKILVPIVKKLRKMAPKT